MLLAGVILWLGHVTHVFDLALRVLRPLIHAIGLPDGAADALLFGFLRRGYCTARVFNVHSIGTISSVPLVIAMAPITLFVPCITQFLMMQKERGLGTALAVAAVILPFAFAVAYLLNLILTGSQVNV